MAKTSIGKKTAIKHILVVDDDDVFRGALTQTLQREGYRVTSVEHPKIAQDIIDVEAVDLVISDINMPGMSGTELLQSIHRSKPKLPVILMTGFAELKETAEAYALGAQGFLPKPFKKEELIDLVQKQLAPTAAASKEPKSKRDENRDLEYCKLNIDDFISGHEIKFDVYIRLSAQKYVKIAHQGEDIPMERISAYKSKSIRHLYMQKDDFKRYMGFNLTLAPLVVAGKSIPKSKKVAFLKHTGEIILEHLYVNGVDEEGFHAAKTIVESTTALLTEPDDMMSLLTMLNSHSDYLYAHGLGVSMYSVMIARAIEWTSPANLYKVAMGGLLHDIGKKEIDREILAKPRKDMSPDEIRLYESHPYRGSVILSDLATIPSDVVQIVFQHHENCLGLGFPMQLPKNRIHPMARLVSVANEFCTLTLKGPSSLNLSPREALGRMTAIFADRLDPVFLQALMHVFKRSL